jgi:hypothetical protein
MLRRLLLAGVTAVECVGGVVLRLVDRIVQWLSRWKHRGEK